MDKLLDHTLQRQNAELATKVDKLTALVERMAAQLAAPLHPTDTPGSALPFASVSTAVSATGGVGTLSVTTTNQVAQTIINVLPWDGDRRIKVESVHVLDAFTKNARLVEYSRLPEHQLTDPEIAPPYVTDLLIDLMKRGHEDPAARNIYLNPKRADQVLVHMKSGNWEVLPLQEATRLMFDGVAQVMIRVSMSNEERRKLPMEAQNALGMAGLLYEEEPDEYVKRARPQVSAHLSNLGAPPIGPARARPRLVAPAELNHEKEKQPSPPSAQKSPVLHTRPALHTRPVLHTPGPPPLTGERAAEALRASRPTIPGEVDEAYIKALAASAEATVHRLVLKLWEAADDGLLSEADKQTALAVCAEYDLDPSRYD